MNRTRDIALAAALLGFLFGSVSVYIWQQGEKQEIIDEKNETIQILEDELDNVVKSLQS